MEITRTHYCESCARAYRPHAGDVFVVQGSTGEQHVKRARMFEGVVRGYTPHLLTLKKTLDGNVVYDSVCLMNNCGIKLLPTEDSYMISVQERYRHVVSIKDWNALVTRWKDTDYEI